MERTTPTRLKLVAVLSCLPLLAACATNPDGTQRLDDRASGALFGALAGCGIATLTGGDCAKGAVVGAIAGFIIGWQFESKRVASAAEVNKRYARQQTIPKDEVKPVSFKTQVRRDKPASDGSSQVKVTSNTDLIGYGDKAPKLEQKYVIYDEKGKVVDTKTETIAAVDGAGSYQTTSSFKLPAEAKGKRYKVETELLADGDSVKKNRYNISWADDLPMLVAAY